MEEERCKLREALDIGSDEDLEERILETYFNMREQYVKNAEKVIKAIKTFAQQMYVRRGELRERLEREKNDGNEDGPRKGPDDATDADACQKRCGITTGSESDETDEWRNNKEKAKAPAKAKNIAKTGKSLKARVDVKGSAENVKEPEVDGTKKSAATKRKAVARKRKKKEDIRETNDSTKGKDSKE